MIFSLVKSDLRRGRIPAFQAAPLRPDSISRLPSGYSSLAQGDRISPHLPSGDFALMGYAGEAARLLLSFSRGGALTAPSRRPDEILHVSFEIDPHLPAIAVALPGARARMMAKPGASFENIEFLKISINTDKLTGFFCKLSGYFRELFSWEMTPRNPGAGGFCHDRPAPP